MNKNLFKLGCITIALTLCIGIFAQQRVNPPSQVNVEFTDMSFLKSVNTENNVSLLTPMTRVAEKTRSVVLSEDFSDYTAGGKIAAQAQAMGRDYWTTWSDAPGTDEDGDVIEFEGDNVGSWSYGADQILLLGSKIGGTWELAFKIYVPTGNEGYFNVLAGFDGGGSGTHWALQAFFNEGGNSPGVGLLDAGSPGSATFNFTHNAWTDVKVLIDLDDDAAEIYINDALIHQWAYSAGTGSPCPKVIYAMDIYPPTAGIANFYIDDIEFSFIQLGTTFESEDFSAYTVGGKIAEEAINLGRGFWTTWSDAPGTAEDGDVALFEGNNVASFTYGADQFLLLGEKSEGTWDIGFKIYVPTGNEGYFNIIAAFDGGGAGTIWALQVYLNQSGTSPGNGIIYAASNTPIPFTFSHNAWINVKIRIDLDNDIAMFYVNNNLIHQWVYCDGTFGEGCPAIIYGLNFFPPTAGVANFYVDDIVFNEIEDLGGEEGIGTFNIETGTGTGDGWLWESPVLTILNASDVTITGRADASDNHHRIEIAANAITSITLSDASIVTGTYVSGPYEFPIYLDEGATLNLTLEGDNIIMAGDYVTGISASTGRTLIIDGDGSLYAVGGWQCAAIGGGLWDWGPCGTVTINGGTIHARGANSSWMGTAGCGIGAGAAYANGDITINGGSIIGVPGNETARGIGSGAACEVGTVTITGNPIIFTNSFPITNPENITGGILVDRNTTHWYGNDNHILEFNTNVPTTNLLTIAEGKSITIPAGMTLTNDGIIVNYSEIIINGTLINNGSILNANSGTITGTVTGNIPVACTPADNIIDLSDQTPPNVGEGWVYANNYYNVLDGADVTITGENSGLRRIEVAANSTTDITLSDATITGILGTTTYVSPFLLNSGAEVNLTVEGENFLTALRSKAAVQVPENATLTIDGTGSLMAMGGEYGGSGIGSAFCENCGSITINGGKITGKTDFTGSYHSGAGIGGGGAGIVFFSFEGYGGLGGDITINGGVVNASSHPSSGAPGIGGGGASVYGGTLTMEENGVAFASSLVTYNGTETDISGVVNGILFDGLDGLLYGEYVEITEDVEIPELYILTIPDVGTLMIHEERTLTVEGTVINNGTIIECGTIIGTINNNQPIMCNDTELHTVTFYVFDAITDMPITDAVIIFDGNELEGYEIEVVEGTYEFTVFHPDYEIYNDTEFIGESKTINVAMSPLIGIGSNAISNVVLHPNPFMNEIFVINGHSVVNVQIVNALGQNVKDVVFNGKTIETKNLSNGIYFVILEGINGEKVVNKMIKR